MNQYLFADDLAQIVLSILFASSIRATSFAPYLNLMKIDHLYQHARNYMATWKVGDTYAAKRLCRRMINAQISPLSVSVDTPGMKRRAKAVDTLLERIR